MTTINIKVDAAAKIRDFINITNRYPYPISLRCGRHTVDGKSLLGLFSLDISRIIAMDIYSDQCEDLLNAVQAYIIP